MVQYLFSGGGIRTNLDSLDPFGEKKRASALRNGARVRIDRTNNTDACVSR